MNSMIKRIILASLLFCAAAQAAVFSPIYLPGNWPSTKWWTNSPPIANIINSPSGWAMIYEAQNANWLALSNTLDGLVLSSGSMTENQITNILHSPIWKDITGNAATATLANYANGLKTPDSELVAMTIVDDSPPEIEFDFSAVSKIVGSNFVGKFTGSGAALTSLNSSNLSGTVSMGLIGYSGTRDSTTFLGGDGVYRVIGAGSATNIMRSAAGAGISVGTNDLLYTFSVAGNLLQWLGLDTNSPVGITVAKAIAGWPTQWPMSAITNSIWLTPSSSLDPTKIAFGTAGINISGNAANATVAEFANGLKTDSGYVAMTMIRDSPPEIEFDFSPVSKLVASNFVGKFTGNGAALTSLPLSAVTNASWLTNAINAANLYGTVNSSRLSVDGSTITVNGSGQLQASSSGGSSTVIVANQDTVNYTFIPQPSALNSTKVVTASLPANGLYRLTIGATLLGTNFNPNGTHIVLRMTYSDRLADSPVTTPDNPMTVETAAANIPPQRGRLNDTLVFQGVAGSSVSYNWSSWIGPDASGSVSILTHYCLERLY